MGIEEINSYHTSKENSFPIFLLRNLSDLSKKTKRSFLSKLTEFGMDVAMISAPLLTYLFQINKFHKTKSSKGFSKFICLLLFLGNIFRIFFWFGTHFKRTLLYQSIGIVIFQVILIHLCIKYQDISILINNTNNRNSGKPLIYHFINWKKTFEYKDILLKLLSSSSLLILYFFIFVFFISVTVFKSDFILYFDDELKIFDLVFCL